MPQSRESEGSQASTLILGEVDAKPIDLTSKEEVEDEGKMILLRKEHLAKMHREWEAGLEHRGFHGSEIDSDKNANGP